MAPDVALAIAQHDNLILWGGDDTTIDVGKRVRYEKNRHLLHLGQYRRTYHVDGCE